MDVFGSKFVRVGLQETNNFFRPYVYNRFRSRMIEIVKVTSRQECINEF